MQTEVSLNDFDIRIDYKFSLFHKSHSKGKDYLENISHHTEIYRSITQSAQIEVLREFKENITWGLYFSREYQNYAQGSRDGIDNLDNPKGGSKYYYHKIGLKAYYHID